MKKIIMVMCLLAMQDPVIARQLEGAVFEEKITVSDEYPELQLNGLGIRYKFFFKIYIAALYVNNPAQDPQKLISNKDAKRISMHFLYDEISGDKLVDAWLDGFKSNLNKHEYQRLESRIKQFNALFETVKENDRVLLDYLPGQGTRVTIKGEKRGLIEGEDFYQALMKIWLGDSPVTQDLKDALLGIEDDDDY